MSEAPGWETGPRRPARHVRVVLAAVLLAGVAAAVGLAVRDSRDLAAPPLVVGSPTAAPAATLASEGPLVPPPPPWPPLSQTTDVVLYAAIPPTTVLAFDVDRQRTVAEVPVRPALGDYPVLLARSGSRFVVQADDGHVYAFGAQRRPRDLGETLLFLPGRSGQIWLVTAERLGAQRRLWVREVDPSGRTITPRTAVPTDAVPVAVVANALILERDGALQRWMPPAGETVTVPGQYVLGAGDRSVVTCGGACRTASVVDVQAGTVMARISSSDRIHTAVVSPDEEFVAAVTGSGVRTSTLRLYAVGAEHQRFATDRASPSYGAHNMTFSPDGRLLFFVTASGHLGVVDTARPRPRLVDAELGLAAAITAGQ